MGEAEFPLRTVVKAVGEALSEQAGQQELRVSTPGGRFHVRWDENASATALGQLAFFAEFLDVSGLFERWVESCPMAYTSPNAPPVRDILGTWLLSILDGQRRYAHVTGLRGDAVAPQILGMKRIVSDESLRRALAHLTPSPKRGSVEERARREAQLARTTAWMDQALAESAGGPEHGLDPGRRHDDQAAVWPPGGGAGELQPAQAGPAEPCDPDVAPIFRILFYDGK